jgi:hypothetical protein
VCQNSGIKRYVARQPVKLRHQDAAFGGAGGGQRGCKLRAPVEGVGALAGGIMGIVNVAHSAFIMLGPFFAFELFRRAGIDPIVASFLSFPFFFAIEQSIANDGFTLVASLDLAQNSRTTLFMDTV